MAREGERGFGVFACLSLILIAAYFYLKDKGRVITQPTNGKFEILCNNLPKEVADKLEELIKNS